MPAAVKMAVAVVYALPDEQLVVDLQLNAGATASEAITASGLLQRYPELNRPTLLAGVFGSVVALDSPLHDGDRVEIYRPLTVDPKQARRRRVMLRASRTVST